MRKSKLLIVESNCEISLMVGDCITHDYQILTSADGMQAWALVIAEEPDLIIGESNICHLNEYDLCKQLKTDERTCHIPLIILTENTREEHQVEILECGADVCLFKPYHRQLLRSYVQNMLLLKEALRQRYGKQIFGVPLDMDMSVADVVFVRKLAAVVGRRMNEHHFNMTLLAREMNMSRSQLYKRFYAATKLTIGAFVRYLRLEKAAVLLLHSGLNVTEVAYEVGFSERKYFSREFKRFFGQSPVDFVADKMKGSQ
ncbi:helix-turn-helix domain-containing protein [Chitinophaga eiseniae]|uniref:Response regulator transcription factor n=1 Tax=Chitinophaga eiseniae TaxID=634771 RepID=A0A847SLE9_9BACT|nr:helix-turn-helix domain-containing protein [Chitinophaga eiseniae]NLR78428.1 response regulator transcription factor [Chitinophaga eiseniae]